MKILPRRAPLAEEATHQEHITPEIEAGTELRAYRRTTVTVERETLSVFTRRVVSEGLADPAIATANHVAGGEIAPRPTDENLSEVSQEMLNDLSGGKS